MHISHPMDISQDEDDKQEYIWELRPKDHTFCTLVEFSPSETETASTPISTELWFKSRIMSCSRLNGWDAGGG